MNEERAEEILSFDWGDDWDKLPRVECDICGRDDQTIVQVGEHYFCVECAAKENGETGAEEG